MSLLYLYREVMSLQVTISCCSNQVMLTVLEDFCWPGAERRTSFCNTLTYKSGQCISNDSEIFFLLAVPIFSLPTTQTIIIFFYPTKKAYAKCITYIYLSVHIKQVHIFVQALCVIVKQSTVKRKKKNIIKVLVS